MCGRPELRRTPLARTRVNRPLRPLPDALGSRRGVYPLWGTIGFLCTQDALYIRKILPAHLGVVIIETPPAIRTGAMEHLGYAWSL